MVTRDQIVQEARTWVGTPHRHQGRLKGIGVDCVGLPIGVGRALGLTDFDITGYGLKPDKEIAANIDKVLTRIPFADAKPGDLLLLTWHRSPVHLCFLVDKGNVIHDSGIVGKVVEHPLDDSWKAAIVCAFRFPGVEE